MKEMPKTYDHQIVESKWYEKWEKNGYFHAEPNPEKTPFTIVIPPPNITGKLHMGHALDNTLQDAIARYKRMSGYEMLWLPGTDHASIATEVKIVEALAAEGLTKKDIGREGFLKRAWQWREEYGSTIVKQLRKMGSSCDWERERFTMDEGCNKAVNHFFVQLYNKGLIYRGNRMINWCPQCGTSLSDAEVEHEDKNGFYWYFRYPGADGSDGIVVATSRPETMFGDVAIAVSPDDERYKGLVGKNVILPLVGREIPVVADPYPDPEKGTGAVKITPAHDENDFEVGQRQGLENLVCINEDATMNELAGKYAGMDRYECRKAWVKDLDEAGYLVKIEDMVIPTGECYRCHTVVEPMLSDQWFVKMKTLAEPAIEAAKDGRLSISRQLWWGHRIPAWYCEDCGEVIVAESAPEVCPKCGSKHLRQDEDVLDTWFSSALWPFSTLGWPEETEDFKYFYPTDVLVTGYDIIFFWVVRMVFSALETTGEVPFHDVYVHGLVRDAQGRKMSKSLGNGIDPLEIIDQYGADALRFMLTTGITPGNDMRFKTDRLEAARNFANKLWNASRFVIMNLEEGQKLASLDEIDQAVLRDEDKWMISRVNDAVKYITEAMEKYDLALAGQRAYDLIWNEYCDWYIELVKERLYGDDEADKQVALAVLVSALKQMLILLHPFMPFITEEIWSYLPGGNPDSNDPKDFLIRADWPVYREEYVFPRETQILEMAMDIIRSIRNIRAEAEASPGKKLHGVILTTGEKAEVCHAAERYIRNLGNLSELTYITDKEDVPDEVMSAVVDGAEVFIPLDDLMDYEAELGRLQKERGRLEGEVKRVVGKLSNQGFVSKAPEKVVAEERAKKEKYEEMLAKVMQRLAIVEKKVGK